MQAPRGEALVALHGILGNRSRGPPEDSRSSKLTKSSNSGTNSVIAKSTIHLAAKYNNVEVIEFLHEWYVQALVKLK